MVRETDVTDLGKLKSMEIEGIDLGNVKSREKSAIDPKIDVIGQEIDAIDR